MTSSIGTLFGYDIEHILLAIFILAIVLFVLFRICILYQDTISCPNFLNRSEKDARFTAGTNEIQIRIEYLGISPVNSSGGVYKQSPRPGKRLLPEDVVILFVYLSETGKEEEESG